MKAFTPIMKENTMLINQRDKWVESLSKDQYNCLVTTLEEISENDIIIGASDAFFPFVDGIETLVQNGVSAIIQPSGSIRDKEIIKFADKLGIILVFSKTRHFKH